MTPQRRISIFATPRAPGCAGILKCFGTNPAAARQMVDMGSAVLFSDGYLTRRHKEMIATYISSLNTCPCCLDSHGFSLTALGVTKRASGI